MRGWNAIILFLFSGFLFAQSLPNDCGGYIQVCGNYDIQMDVSGPGIQEIAWNVCESWEHNSLWLHFTVEQSGTLGFTLIPESRSIHEDYDFWIFGPDVNCGALGTAIRCSTTNPAAAGQANNHTGLDEVSTDVSEGPGPDGDSFLQWLDVTDGESYFLVIDRPLGDSAFRLEWTGTAILENPLENYTTFNVAPIQVCDLGNDGVESYDLNALNSQWINDLNGIEITYHSSETDAASDLNPLSQPSDLSSGLYFVRIENTGSKCFELKELIVEVGGLPLENPVIELCDDGNDGTEIYDLSQAELFESYHNFITSFFETLDDAQNNTDTVNPLSTISASNPVRFVRVENDEGCVDYTTIEFVFVEKPVVTDQAVELCINEITNPHPVSQYAPLFQTAAGFEVRFYHSASDRENNIPLAGEQHAMQIGDNVIYVRVFNGICHEDALLTLVLNDKPQLGADETIALCAEQFPFELPPLPAGYENYSWSTGESGMNTITVEQTGTYMVEVMNEDGCVAVKTYGISEMPIPQILALDVINENKINVLVSVTEGNLLYSLNNGPWQNSPVFEGLEPGWHAVKVKLQQGCESEAVSTYLLAITNFLSPNGDGLNDTWAFPGLEEFSGSTISIFDRYGKEIYSENGDKPFIWDGTFNGRKLSTGDYWYLISLPDGRKRSGHITIRN